MKDFTASQIRDLITHMRDEKSLARHDLGHCVADILEQVLNKLEYLEGLVKPK